MKPFVIKTSLSAEVVELVDTLGSGSSVRRDVGVRVSPSAPKNEKGPQSSRVAASCFFRVPVASAPSPGNSTATFSGGRFAWRDQLRGAPFWRLRPFGVEFSLCPDLAHRPADGMLEVGKSVSMVPISRPTRPLKDSLVCFQTSKQRPIGAMERFAPADFQ